MNIDLMSLTESAGMFDDLLALESTCFTRFDGKEDRYSKASFGLWYEITKRGNHHLEEYLRLRSMWLENSVCKILESSPDFIAAIKFFRRKSIICIPPWGVREGLGEYGLPSPFDSSVPKLTSIEILKGITIKALLFYETARLGGVGAYVEPAQDKLQKIAKLADKLISEINSDDYIKSVVPKLLLRYLHKISSADAFKNWEAKSSRSWRRRFSLSKRHEKGGREFFVRVLSSLYRTYFQSYQRLDGGNSCEKPTRKVFLRSLDKPEGQMIIGVFTSKEVPVHADVLVNLVAIIDPEITERKVRDISARQAKRDLELSQEGRKFVDFRYFPSGQELVHGSEDQTG